MKKKFLFLIIFLLLAQVVLGIPVSYKAKIDKVSSLTDEFCAVSKTGITKKIINETNTGVKVLLNHLENKDELVEFTFNEKIVRRINHLIPGSKSDLGRVFVYKNDTDMDGYDDDNDNCPYAYNPLQSLVCTGDIDGDGILNSVDPLTGDSNLVDTNVLRLGLMIDNDSNVSKSYSGVHKLKFLSNNSELVVFDFNFSLSSFFTGNVSIYKQSKSSGYGSIRIFGIDLSSQGQTKTVYVDRLSSEDYVCVVDKEIALVSEMPSVACSGSSEKAVPCSTAGSSAYGYTCTIVSNKFKVEGLIHSGVVESSYTPPTPPPTPSPGGGGSSGGGGGGSLNRFYDWECSEWSKCSEDGMQTRTCVNKGIGGADTGKPKESRTCYYSGSEEEEEEEENEESNNEDNRRENTEPQNLGSEGEEEEETEQRGGFAGITGNVIKNITGLKDTNPVISSILLLVILGLAIFILVSNRGGFSSDPFTRASNLHKKAHKAHKSGNYKKADKFYKKAQGLREAAEKKLK